MRLLSECKNEEALDLLVDILEPATEMMSDKEVIEMLYDRSRRMEGIKTMIRKHKKAVVQILAALDGCPVSEYEFGFFVLPSRLLEVVNDKELLSFFTAQQTLDSKNMSSSATENTEDREN